MTIKVFMNDGKIEEYPNAHITWEWDDAEGELGPDSGFRINSIDKNFTSVSVFVYPSEFNKIEITSEECDKVFKRPPYEEVISGKRFRLFAEIDKESKRQDEIWGEGNFPVRTTFEKEILTNQLYCCRDRIALLKYGPGFNVLLEDVCEAFLETEPEKQRAEMVQIAAVAVQIIEYLDRGMGNAIRNDR